MGHLAVSLKMCQAQELQKCEWPQGMRRVLAVLWKQMTHSSPDATGKGDSVGQSTYLLMLLPQGREAQWLAKAMA